MPNPISLKATVRAEGVFSIGAARRSILGAPPASPPHQALNTVAGLVVNSCLLEGKTR